MDLEKFERMVLLVKRDLENEQRERKEYNARLRQKAISRLSFKSMKICLIPELEAKVKNLMVIAQKSLPDYQELFAVTHNKIDDQTSRLTISDAISVLQHILEILEIEKSSEEKVKEMKVFESAEEKLKQVNLSFRKEDYTSALNNLNTTLELVLKDKLGIPTTITKINTSNIIEVLVKYKVGPYVYLNEAKKRIVMIDNKVKHQSFVPSKTDCINAMKLMEELIAKLRDKEIKLSEEVRNKIYEGL